MNELKTLNDRLHKENVAKDRELRQLNKDLQQNEQTIVNLRNELCLAKCHRQDVSKKDVEVTTGCYAAECGDWEPVKDPSELLTCREQIQRMEKELKCNNGDVISLRTTNVALHKELRMLRGVSAALASEVRDIKQRNDFKDEIIKELRIQLKRAKSQLKSRSLIPVWSGESNVEVLTSALLRRGATCGDGRDVVRRRASCDVTDRHSLSDDCRSPRIVMSTEEYAVNND